MKSFIDDLLAMHMVKPCKLIIHKGIQQQIFLRSLYFDLQMSAICRWSYLAPAPGFWFMFKLNRTWGFLVTPLVAVNWWCPFIVAQSEWN